MSRRPVPFVFVLLLAQTACATASAPGAPEPSTSAAVTRESAPSTAPARPGPASTESDATRPIESWCAQARERVLAPFRQSYSNPTAIGDVTPDDFDCEVAPDLDGDGIADFLVSLAQSTRGRALFLFLRHESAIYVGMIRADDEHAFHCMTTRTRGFCDISASELMIHGDTQTIVYRFDGSLYR